MSVEQDIRKFLERDDQQEKIAALAAARADAKDELCRRKLVRFMREGWAYVEPGAPYLHNWHIDAIAEHLDALYRGWIKRLIINMPPRCAKSTLGSVLFPSWVWLNDPAFKFITTSYERALAVRDANKSRRLFDTEWYQRLNRRLDDEGHVVPIFRMGDRSIRDLRRLKDNEDFYENDRGGKRIAVGVDGGVTGKGGDLLSVDDPQNPNQAHSEAERIHTLTWWDQTMSTRLDNQKTGRKLIIMQRLHSYDLTGHELAKQVGYVHLKLPMEFDPTKRCVTSLGIDAKTGKKREWADPRTKLHELLHNDRFDEAVVQALKIDLTPYGAAGQLQQEPIPEGGGTLKVDWFKTYLIAPIFDVIAMSVDCAFTDSDNSSYVVIQVWGFSGPNAYLLKNVRQHLSFVGTEAMIEAVRDEYAARHMMPSAILVENKANGPAIISRLVKKFPGIIPCEPRKMGGSKEARASSISPFVQSGNVFVPEGAPWLADFFIEVSQFPKYKTDDQVDAMSQALWWRFLSNVNVKNEAAKAKFLLWAKASDNLFDDM